MLQFIRLDHNDLGLLSSTEITTSDLITYQTMLKGMASKTCAYCHGYGHSRARCTTRRAVCKLANEVNLRATNGFIMGLIVKEEMTLGVKRSNITRKTLEEDRLEIRQNP